VDLGLHVDDPDSVIDRQFYSGRICQKNRPVSEARNASDDTDVHSAQARSGSSPPHTESASECPKGVHDVYFSSYSSWLWKLRGIPLVEHHMLQDFFVPPHVYHSGNETFHGLDRNVHFIVDDESATGGPIAFQAQGAGLQDHLTAGSVRDRHQRRFAWGTGDSTVIFVTGEKLPWKCVEALGHRTVKASVRARPPPPITTCSLLARRLQIRSIGGC